MPLPILYAQRTGDKNEFSSRGGGIDEDSQRPISINRNSKYVETATLCFKYVSSILSSESNPDSNSEGIKLITVK